MINKHNPRTNEHKTVIQHSLNPEELKKNAAILIYGEMTKIMTNVDRMLMESFVCQ